MAGITEAEEISEEGPVSHSQEVEIVDIDETYSDNECPSDNNETFECVEIKDDDDKEEDIPRVISLVDDTISMNSSVSSTTTTTSITEIIEESPSKLRRSARTSVRSYRRNNNSSSSESEPEIIFIKKTQKRKGTPLSINRKSKVENDKYDQKTVIKGENLDEKENKSIESEIKLSNKNSKSNRQKSTNGNRTPTPIHHKRKTELELIYDGITQKNDFFDDPMCRKIEKKIDQIAEKAKCGLYKQKTYDRVPLRNKYFFGEGYTYGKQMNVRGIGKERLYEKGQVDEIPKWIEKHIIQKLCDDKFVENGFINCVAINEYFPGGCIVSHIDPIHIFDRPIISISFNSKSYLSFGCKFSFNPIRTTEPILALPLERGTLTSLSGYAADNVTHCIRPQDICERRCVIILRRVFPDAPRVGDPVSPEYPLSLVRRNHPRSYSYENTQIRASRKRSYDRDHYDNGYRSSNQSNKKRKTRHSY